MSVPFLDLGRLHRSIRDELDAAFDRVLESSAFVGGEEVAAFEAEWATACRQAHAVGCNSGTDALALALHALGVGEGDEVVVPSMTFFATAEAVVHVGAVPVVADVEEGTLLLGPEQVDAVRTTQTRAVLPVHLYGHVVPFEHLEAWAADDLLVVEDAAQAHLASWNEVPVGTVGHAVCFSFFPGKNMGALGDAGALVTDDPEVADRARRRQDHGRVEKYVHAELGLSSRLDGLQAALLRAKLGSLEGWTQARRVHAERYRNQLAGHPVELVPWEPGAVHHLLVVRVPADQRDGVRRHLTERGIGCGIHYPVPLSLQPPFAGGRRCPVAEDAAASVLSLPLDPLMSEADVDLVCEVLVEAVGGG
jgi:dTDP-4-amino-4,6-dideoxygalactose transaminase